MTNSAEQIRAWTGPAVLSYGFRPMFLGGAVWAAVAMALWIGVLTGQISLTRSAFDPLAFHVHELLWGFGAAVIAGFLLTAVPNWTGRLPIVGWPLAALFALWVAGRVAVSFSGELPALAVAAIDLSFLSVLAFAMGREIVAGGNTKNLPVLGLIGLLVIANGVFHVEAAGGAASSGGGMRLGMTVVIVLIVLIGGRIVPSFTRNWLARRTAGAMPVPFGRFDKIAIAVAVLTLLAFVATPGALATGVLAALAAVLHAARVLRWAGWRTGAEPLVAILHVGYAFVPLGFLLLAGAILLPTEVPRVAALHAFLAGAMGVMTLAVMTRASLGHTGRNLHAGAGTIVIYALAVAGALARVAAAFAPGAIALLHVSAAGWIGAFALFAFLYGPLLMTPRPPA